MTLMQMTLASGPDDFVSADAHGSHNYKSRSPLWCSQWEIKNKGGSGLGNASEILLFLFVALGHRLCNMLHRCGMSLVIFVFF